ncbi:methyl-accepting chemotaxis protein [Paenibacillus psychroresistens]|nr:methyl-accepting chemotaxis protein [Paenibacillus psychroresistens]
MPFYQKTYTEDTCIIIADTEKVIGYFPGKDIDVKIPVGAPIEKFIGTVSYNALVTGTLIQEERGSEVVGFPYISTANPIILDGQVIGVISSIVLNSKMDLLRSSSEGLSASVEEMTATTQAISAAFNNVIHQMDSLSESSQVVNNDIQSIQKIISFVQEISKNSNVLGLNAAIEGARAGEHGKGFMVVATEIRKMANNSKEAAMTIGQQLIDMEAAVTKMNQMVIAIKNEMNQQGGTLQDLNSAFEHIAATADDLASSCALKVT